MRCVSRKRYETVEEATIAVARYAFRGGDVTETILVLPCRWCQGFHAVDAGNREPQDGWVIEDPDDGDE